MIIENFLALKFVFFKYIFVPPLKSNVQGCGQSEPREGSDLLRRKNLELPTKCQIPPAPTVIQNLIFFNLI